MAHCHCPGLKIEIPAGARRIVLAGNPNTGKSVFFNHFTGMYVDVSNYPGTTLDISYGRYGSDVVIDTPGVYGISSFNDEERIARDIILSADLVLNVVSAAHLERDLFLTQQIIDTGVPVIVALNMMDDAKRMGIEVDVDRLSQLLGVPVIPTVAVKKEGFDRLKTELFTARPGHATPGLEEELNQLLNRVGSRGEALLVLEEDPVIAARHGLEPDTRREEIYRRRRERVNAICQEVVRETSQGASVATTLGRWMIKPLTGVPILLLALWAMYKAIGVFIAGTVVGITEETIMQGIYEPAVRQFVEQFIPQSSIPGTILIGEFGLLTMTVTYLLGLLMPLVVGFYFFLSLFEDSGYLPRIATLVDRLLTSIGLNGRGVIPIILGFGCVTMATITTRLLSSDRERKIAIFLLGLTIPCSAQLGVIAGMLATLGPQYIALYALVIFSVLVMAGTLLSTLLPGKSADLFIDLPPLRLPRLDNVLKKTGTKSYHFLKEAAPLFALGALIISTFQVTGILEFLQNLLAPLTVGWLNLPRKAATAFIMGIVRRDFGAAGLTDLALTPLQTIVALITITLFVPCIASVLVIFKERTKKEALFIWGSSWVVAFLVGGLVAQLARLFSPAGDKVQVLPVILVFAALTLAIVGMCMFLRRARPTTNIPR
ncbi:ferrous iron transport protein B [Desulfofundulus thermosubterraneus]|uniref:Ferrous iron transport protein B n=1 Tax=Desulfofundulus thermosubterraneus DSM 16057 TaxID=1121432 RepID=A0A1M6J5A2_9FIRM|nr:ferrous iron transport protein B [Desulfofundulus thermosubterraneus]SHJ41797.1 ferrous iron transport protein B [Desulfofundulus thermosubterraneus DSM 16057]